MDIRKVKKLIELMEESDLAEIEVKEGEDSVRISMAKNSNSSWVKADDLRLEETNPSQTRSGEGTTVNAPMVGSFYRAVSPSSPPFVEVGDRIKVGDVLCIIESMKMMNQIRSEVSGTIEAVLIENGQSVQFDQPLFTVV